MISLPDATLHRIALSRCLRFDPPKVPQSLQGVTISRSPLFVSSEGPVGRLGNRVVFADGRRPVVSESRDTDCG